MFPQKTERATTRGTDEGVTVCAASFNYCRHSMTVLQHQSRSGFCMLDERLLRQGSLQVIPWQNGLARRIRAVHVIFHGRQLIAQLLRVIQSAAFTEVVHSSAHQ